MRDKRAVGDLSVEELERVIALRKREARLRQRNEAATRRVDPNHQHRTAHAASHSSCEDAPLEDEFDQQLDNTPNPLRVPWHRVLLGMEATAFIGLILLVFGLFQSIQGITQTSAAVQSQYQATANARLILPTATPLINIAAVVLPVGHKVHLNARGEVVGATFNFDEVPAQYRDQYRAIVAAPVVQPTASPEGPVRIRIARLKIDSTVVSGDDWQALQLGVGHHLGTANPGQVGNMVLSAHNDVYGELFRDLDKLEAGDPVVVSTNTRDYTYIVQGRQIVKPTDVYVLDSRGNEQRLTLISCYPYRVDTQRIVVFATLRT